MPGPAPNPDARRRNKRQVDFVLPRGGRKGRAPAFPIKGTRVPATWADLWKLPQAAAWEQLGIARTVARYAMLLQQAEKPGAAASLHNEVRQLEDRLGLSPMAMLRLRWVISEDEVADRRTTKTAPAATKPGGGSRERLRIVG
ncbi:hypothetical protein [Curtobacterium sp. CFBP9011]|uniref:phage terminase small subunit n=1 Tax=Curtobacterium sp. CFBP9011 TaxID=3096530 RepID=UPI002A6A2183|nr:hypothetical protein [Curtobacterium sp. CFBP9011]MDY1005734.1 hypothetical protein [Curtobacterium sp. CFBP9011]